MTIVDPNGMPVQRLQRPIRPVLVELTCQPATALTLHMYRARPDVLICEMVSMLRIKLHLAEPGASHRDDCEGAWVADLMVEGPHARLHGRQQRAHRKVLDEALDVVQVGHREAGSQALHTAVLNSISPRLPSCLDHA